MRAVTRHPFRPRRAHDGPDHYRAAEKLLAEAEADARLVEPSPRAAWSLELAKVHMGLALAAATAAGATGPDSHAWADAAGTKLGGDAFGTS
jgi:hypothetical protein